MADQAHRLSYALGKGGYLRLLWKATTAASTMELVVLPHGMYTIEADPMNEDVTESDSLGRYLPPTLESIIIRVNLRRRWTATTDVISLDALGVRALTFVDRVYLDIGNTGRCDVIDHMSVGPYSRDSDQKGHVHEGFSLMGGYFSSRNIAIPASATSSGTVPATAFYVNTSVAVPSGL